MANELPFGVKYSRIINIVSIAMFILVGFCLAGIAVPNFIKGAHQAAEETGRAPSDLLPLIGTIVGLVAFLIGLIPVFLLVILNKALLKLKENARIWQIVVSCLFLTGFPVGTIMYGISLYYMLFDKETKEAFGISTTTAPK